MDEGGCSRSPARPRAGLLLPLPLSCLLGCWRAVDWRGVGCVRDGDVLHEPHELVSITQLGYNVGQHVGFAAGLPQHVLHNPRRRALLDAAHRRHVLHLHVDGVDLPRRSLFLLRSTAHKLTELRRALRRNGGGGAFRWQPRTSRASRAPGTPAPASSRASAPVFLELIECALPAHAPQNWAPALDAVALQLALLGLRRPP